MYAFTEVLRRRNGVLGALHGTAFEALKPVVVKSNGGTVSLGRGRHRVCPPSKPLTPAAPHKGI
jgi:hypothetical protein